MLEKLIKTKLQIEENGRCQLGIRIRANPGNQQLLLRIAILVVVPPDVRVEEAPDGGLWDEVKRTLTWTCDSLPPGHGMDIQPTFTAINASHNDIRRFPILLQCHGDYLFSRLELQGTTTFDDRPLNLDVKQESTALYRKV